MTPATMFAASAAAGVLSMILQIKAGRPLRPAFDLALAATLATLMVLVLVPALWPVLTNDV